MELQSCKPLCKCSDVGVWRNGVLEARYNRADVEAGRYEPLEERRRRVDRGGMEVKSAGGDVEVWRSEVLGMERWSGTAVVDAWRYGALEVRC